jgi:hypothetical protein
MTVICKTIISYTGKLYFENSECSIRKDSKFSMLSDRNKKFDL